MKNSELARRLAYVTGLVNQELLLERVPGSGEPQMACRYSYPLLPVGNPYDPGCMLVMCIESLAESKVPVIVTFWPA
jgi:hypothetical protein